MPVLQVPTFEVVTSGILDFEGQKHEEVDYFSWVFALCHFYITRNETRNIDTSKDRLT